MKDVDLVTPTGTCLASAITVEVKKGEGLVVTGPVGAGYIYISICIYKYYIKTIYERC